MHEDGYLGLIVIQLSWKRFDAMLLWSADVWNSSQFPPPPHLGTCGCLPKLWRGTKIHSSCNNNRFINIHGIKINQYQCIDEHQASASIMDAGRRGLITRFQSRFVYVVCVGGNWVLWTNNKIFVVKTMKCWYWICDGVKRLEIHWSVLHSHANCQVLIIRLWNKMLHQLNWLPEVTISSGSKWWWWWCTSHNQWILKLYWKGRRWWFQHHL